MDVRPLGFSHKGCHELPCIENASGHLRRLPASLATAGEPPLSALICAQKNHYIAQLTF